MITADKITAGAITCAKFSMFGESGTEAIITLQKQAVKQCQCCGSRFFTKSVCDYCRSPQ